MSDGPTYTEAVQAAIEAMDGTLAIARALVEGGRRIDLAGLEQQVAALCTAVMTLEPEAAKTMRGGLERLLRHVDDLAAQLDRT